MLALVLIAVERTELVDTKGRVQQHAKDGVVSAWALIGPRLDVNELLRGRDESGDLNRLQSFPGRAAGIVGVGLAERIACQEWPADDESNGRRS